MTNNNPNFDLPSLSNEFNNLVEINSLDGNSSNSANESLIGLKLLLNEHRSFDNELFSIFHFKKADNDITNTEERISNEENTEMRQKFFVENKKRGRKNKKEGKKIHDKNTIDNLLRKVQVHYLSFIIKFLNTILLILNKKNIRFKKLDYKFKQNVRKDFVDILKKSNIGEIISSKISGKYKKEKNDNFNENLLKKYKEDRILNKIFSENYLILFRKIYYKSQKKINLKEYGLDIGEGIKLSDDVKMYKDLLKDKKGNELNEEYKSNLNKCIFQHFFSNSFFKTS